MSYYMNFYENFLVKAIDIYTCVLLSICIIIFSMNSLVKARFARLSLPKL